MKKINLFPDDDSDMEIRDSKILNAKNYVVLWKDKDAGDVHGQTNHITQAEMMMAIYFVANPHGWEETKKFVDFYVYNQPSTLKTT